MSALCLAVPTAYFAPSFVEGATRLYARVRVDDDFVQAECMRLERAGRLVEADNLLETWVRQGCLR